MCWLGLGMKFSFLYKVVWEGMSSVCEATLLHLLCEPSEHLRVYALERVVAIQERRQVEARTLEEMEVYAVVHRPAWLCPYELIVRELERRRLAEECLLVKATIEADSLGGYVDSSLQKDFIAQST